LVKRLEKQFDFMERNRDVDVCGSWYELIGSKSGIIKTPVEDLEIKDTLFFHDCIAHPTVIIRKESFDRFNIKYDENLRSAQDYELWCREIDRLKYANMPEVLLKYRVHEKQTGMAKIKEQDKVADLVRMKNMGKIGIVLSGNEFMIYSDVLRNVYEIESVEQMEYACEILDKIGSTDKNKFGTKFTEIIRNYMKNIAEKGIKRKKTSFKLFFSVFWKWIVFRSVRNKARYVYHAARNLLE